MSISDYARYVVYETTPYLVEREREEEMKGHRVSERYLELIPIDIKYSSNQKLNNGYDKILPHRRRILV